MRRPSRVSPRVLVLVLGFLAFLAANLTPAPAWCQDAAYEQLIDRALEAFAAREFATARTLFEQAHARRPSARTLRGLGVTAVELRRYESAEDELEAALADSRRPLTIEQQREVHGLLEWMRANLGTLHLTLTPPSAIARIDDRRTAARSLRLDPGDHVLEVRADGHQPHTRRFTVARGSELSLKIDLAPEFEPVAAIPRAPATARGRPRDEPGSVFEHWWFWTALGVAAVGGAAAVWAVTREPEPKPFEPGGVEGVFMTLRVNR